MMQTFEQLAQRNANNAVEFKRKYTQLSWIGVALSAVSFGVGSFFVVVAQNFPAQIAAGILFGAMAVFNAGLAIKTRRKAKSSFDSFMALRDECLDSAKRFR